MCVFIVILTCEPGRRGEGDKRSSCREHWVSPLCLAPSSPAPYTRVGGSIGPLWPPWLGGCSLYRDWSVAGHTPFPHTYARRHMCMCAHICATQRSPGSSQQPSGQQARLPLLLSHRQENKKLIQSSLLPREAHT